MPADELLVPPEEVRAELRAREREREQALRHCRCGARAIRARVYSGRHFCRRCGRLEREDS